MIIYRQNVLNGDFGKFGPIANPGKKADRPKSGIYVFFGLFGRYGNPVKTGISGKKVFFARPSQ